MNSIVNVIKLDRRYNGSHIFKYMLEFKTVNKIEKYRALNTLRNWCWEVWGPSSELDSVMVLYRSDKMDPTWAWDTNFDNMRLYLKDDQTLSAYMLKWS